MTYIQADIHSTYVHRSNFHFALGDQSRVVLIIFNLIG